ncbi:MAG: hypothetical protein Q9207_001601 [Kuettlingeria erythrocarpa]
MPSPDPPKPRIQSWPSTDNPLASVSTSMTAAIDSSRDLSFLCDGSYPHDEFARSGLASPPCERGMCLQSPRLLENPVGRHPRSGAPHQVPCAPKTYDNYQRDHQALHACLSMCPDPNPCNGLDDLRLLRTTTTSSIFSGPTSPQRLDGSLPPFDVSVADTDPFGSFQLSTATPPRSGESQLRVDSMPQEDCIEEICREPDSGKEWLMCLPSPSASQSSFSSEESMSIYGFPRFSSSSLEMLLLGFDRETCGILSVKDGPSENPWRTMIWPLAQESPALYHAIVSMAAFHTARSKRNMIVEGITHMERSIENLGSGINEGTIRLDAALATTLALAFSESWDLHTSTGIQHLKGAKWMVHRALIMHRNNKLTPSEVARLRFLCNTWVYMVVIARLTSVDDDESNDFDYALNASIDPHETEHEVDPLMGCASTLFPLIGRVANLVRRVRKTSRNSINVISQANDLKTAIEAWDPPEFFAAPEDKSLEIQHSLDTAEAYRWATLLYLHQAVPEIPSKSSDELAGKVIVYLLKVPLSSRAVIVQIYPLLAAGCEVSSNEDRAWVEDRWAAMMQRMLIGNLDKCLVVVKEVWDRRDADESHRARMALRTVQHRRSSGHSIPAKMQGAYSSDEAVPHDNPFPSAGRKMEHSSSPPKTPHVQRRRPSEMIEDLNFERTVRGRLHWVGVMKDRGWEILLG